MRIEKREGSRQYGQRAADGEPRQLPARGPEMLRQRVDAVLGAKIRGLVDAAAEIRVVVEQVIRAVGEK